MKRVPDPREIQGQKARLGRYHHFPVMRVGCDSRALDEHAALVEAVRRPDLAEFERILTAHLRRASEEIALLLPATATQNARSTASSS